MKLLHLSEEEKIEKFIPRTSKKMWDYEKYVWAISEDKVHNYLFPRACPRICTGNKKIEALADWVNIEKVKDKKAIIFVPKQWELKIKDSVLYQYEFAPANFSIIDEIAGYYVSKQSEIPVQKTILKDCPSLLKKMNVALIFKETQELKEICQKVIESMQEFSIIKWNNLS